jgi:bifunctional UDP-N-acetylglucosamine pyrophosphorylase/glucosamine-1-phosphate N-acetyltransferase
VEKLSYTAVILAAGKGVRMKSNLPKVVHKAAGKPLVAHVVDAVQAAGIKDIVVVVGHGREHVEKVFTDDGVQLVVQEEQLGTGHALQQAQEQVDPASTVLVLAGDIPLLRPSTLKALLDYHQQGQAEATVLTTHLEQPTGYGRVLRDEQGYFARIVEEKDASPEEKSINEINSGIYCFQAGSVFRVLQQLRPANAQGEYYLTDVLEILKSEGHRVQVMAAADSEEIHGVNDRIQLAQAEKILRRRKNDQLMRDGVTLVEPDSIMIDSQVTIGRDTVVMPFTLIQGKTIIGEGCEIGPWTNINDSTIGDRVVIESSRVKEAQISDDCVIGPYAYLRPGAQLETQVKVGDFVEIKQSTIGSGSKIPHLSYVGDALVGRQVNIGAGTITCNYDGQHKHQTILEDHVFIGSNTNLVAPVRIGESSVTGAGSTITRDVPAQSLAVERADQRVVPWKKKKQDH